MMRFTNRLLWYQQFLQEIPRFISTDEMEMKGQLIMRNIYPQNVLSIYCYMMVIGKGRISQINRLKTHWEQTNKLPKNCKVQTGFYNLKVGISESFGSKETLLIANCSKLSLWTINIFCYYYHKTSPPRLNRRLLKKSWKCHGFDFWQACVLRPRSRT